MKRNKRYFLKTNVENFLTSIVMLSIAFVAMTIDSIGNNTYNIILIVIMIINVIIMKILTKFGKSFQ
ncbi:MAG: hypothetical protein PUJ51_19365 [Clostridiales bacterium]|nr:hypothetical protein [Clostridiales bacterium]